MGERYKMVPKESKDLVQGKYGKTPAPIPQEIIKKILAEEEQITCRPADLIEPELENIREQIKEYIEKEEDVLLYGMLPQVAEKYFKYRIEKKQKRDIIEEDKSGNKMDAETIAVISAAISLMEDTSEHKLKIKSIRRVEQNSPIWSTVGRMQRFQSKL